MFQTGRDREDALTNNDRDVKWGREDKKNPQPYERNGGGYHKARVRLSTDLFYLAGADAARAYVHAYMRTVRSYRFHELQVRF